jgi:intein-encoded DNA endonuclease-like protein
MSLVKITRADVYPEPLSWPLREQLRFVRGFADGEGGPKLYYHRAMNSTVRYANNRHVALSNTDLPLLATVKEILSKVLIKSAIYLDRHEGKKRARKDAYVLVISSGESLERFQKHVGITNPGKAAILVKIVGSYKWYLKTVKSPEETEPLSRP